MCILLSTEIQASNYRANDFFSSAHSQPPRTRRPQPYPVIQFSCPLSPHTYVRTYADTFSFLCEFLCHFTLSPLLLYQPSSLFPLDGGAAIVHGPPTLLPIHSSPPPSPRTTQKEFKTGGARTRREMTRRRANKKEARSGILVIFAAPGACVTRVPVPEISRLPSFPSADRRSYVPA